MLIAAKIDDQPGVGKTVRDPALIRSRFMKGLGTGAAARSMSRRRVTMLLNVLLFRFQPGSARVELRLRNTFENNAALARAGSSRLSVHRGGRVVGPERSLCRSPAQCPLFDTADDELKRKQDQVKNHRPGKNLGDRKHLLRNDQPMPNAAERSYQLRDRYDANSKGEIDLPARQKVGDDPGQDDLGEILNRTRPEGLDHLPKVPRHAFHRVQAVNQKYRRANNAHDKKYSEFDRLERKD